jgi:hypothetical protein
MLPAAAGLPPGLNGREAAALRKAVRKGVERLNLLPADREKLVADLEGLIGRAAG